MRVIHSLRLVGIAFVCAIVLVPGIAGSGSAAERGGDSPLSSRVAPTIGADRLDYRPAGVVRLTGWGWPAHARVAITARAGHGWLHRGRTRAGADGTFAYSFRVSSRKLPAYRVTATVGTLRAATRFTDGNVTLHVAADSAGIGSMSVPYQDKFNNTSCSGSGSSEQPKNVAATGTASIGVQNTDSMQLGVPTIADTAHYSFDRWTSGSSSTDSGTTISGSPTPCISGSPTGVNGNITDAYAHFSHVDQPPSAPGTPTGQTPNDGNFILSWGASTDPEGDPITYTLEHENASQSSYSVVSTGISGTSFTFAPESEGTWTYVVSACDPNSCSSTSSASSPIKVDRTPPNAPTVATSSSPTFDPTPGSNESDDWYKDSVTITWTAAGDPILADGSAGSGVASVTPAATVTANGAFSLTGTATDAAGNVSAGTTKGGNVDAAAPVLVASATTAGNAYTSGTWANHDVVVHFSCTDAGGSGVATVTSDETFSAAGAGQFATGSCTDEVGHTSTASFTNIDIDKTAPVIDSHADVVAEATSSAGAVVTYSGPGAADNLGGSGIAYVACVPATGTTYPLGDTTVTCTAADQAGNTSGSTFKVTVKDTTAPVIDPHVNVAAEATGPSGATVSYTAPNATDLVDGAVAPVCSPASGSTFAVGTTTVHCTATDAHSNSSSSSFDVIVTDTKAPTFGVAPNVSAEAVGDAGAVVTYAVPAATDIVDGGVKVSCVPPPGTIFPAGTTNVTCSATDAHGNTAFVSFTITVVATGTLPPPVAGVSFNAIPTSGTVLIQLPNTETFVPLTEGMQLPVGTKIDATGGTMELISADGDGYFWAGTFLVLEPLTSTAADRALSGFAGITGPRTTNLNLTGGNFKNCSKRTTFGVDLDAKGKPKPPVRSVWGKTKGKGNFRTKGKFSSAEVRGTWWQVSDVCTGTITRVKKGIVAVKDFVRHKTVLVKAGHSYFAKAPAPKKKAPAKTKGNGKKKR
jgi:hypothetical protein